ncbi:MAG: NAD-dependent epimerase/dehydratase family protein [Chloroflexi bacterium]|nr:NAD-dependent epimerase/dehydratase family protein [Chloroflexota bacterium]
MTEFWSGKRVLITGCTGLLGAWLTAVLVKAGAEVVGLIRDTAPHSELIRSQTIRKINVVRGELCNYQLLERTLAEYEVQIIFHLAAQTIVGIANRAPLSTFETNIRGTYMLLEAARRNSTVSGIVVASSDKVYGEQTDLPYVEASSLNGRQPYDVSKSCADLIAQTYAQSYSLPVMITRCANLYGGGDLNWNRLLPGTIRTVLGGERPIIRSDGTIKRDYLYVQDAVRGFLLAAQCLAMDDMYGEIFNLGMGQPKTALEMVQTVIQISDYPHLEPIILDSVKNEIQDQFLCIDKAQRTLNWAPQYALEDGLVETMAWYREFL